LKLVVAQGVISQVVGFNAIVRKNRDGTGSIVVVAMGEEVRIRPVKIAGRKGLAGWRPGESIFAQYIVSGLS
jgi:hypothetical protein